MKVIDIIDGIDLKVDDIRQKIDKLSKERVKLCDECDILSVNLNTKREGITSIDAELTALVQKIEDLSHIEQFLKEEIDGKDTD